MLKNKEPLALGGAAAHADVESCGIIVIRTVPVFITLPDSGLNAALHSSRKSAEAATAALIVEGKKKKKEKKGRWD